MSMTMVRRQPCVACPYRCDVPSGVWVAEDYAKLPPYDAPTGEQPVAAFMCHATPDVMCHGWAVVHSNRGGEYDLLALRLRPAGIPAPTVPLFTSGAAAAAHGIRDIAHPSRKARQLMTNLRARYARLREGILT